MKQHLNTLLFEASLLSLVAAGWLWGIEGAQHVVRFGLWVLAPVCVVAALSTDVAAGVAARPPRPAAIRTINYLTWWAVLVLLVWHGAYATGAAVLVILVCGAIHGQTVRRLRAARDMGRSAS